MSKTEHFPIEHSEIKYNYQLSDYRWSRHIDRLTRTPTAGQYIYMYDEFMTINLQLYICTA